VPLINAETIRTVTFDSAPDGYDKDAVDAYHREVADTFLELTSARDVVSASPAPLVADGPHDRAISETLRGVAARSATELLETASRDAADILAKADSDAAEVRASAEAAAVDAEKTAQDLLADARRQAAAIVESAAEEGRVKGAEAAAELEAGMRAALRGVEAQTAAERAKLTKLAGVTEGLREGLAGLAASALSDADRVIAGQTAPAASFGTDTPGTAAGPADDEDVADDGSPLVSFINKADASDHGNDGYTS
jgi:DivIVA domain-containing protein